MKTTPKPSATKNKSGELGPLEPPPLLPEVVADAAADVVVECIIDDVLEEVAIVEMVI